MIIPIDKEIRIRGTAECWQLEKSIIRKGMRDWAPFKYFKSLSDAVGEACGREIRLHPANSLNEGLQAIDKIAARYNKLLEDALESREAA